MAGNGVTKRVRSQDDSFLSPLPTVVAPLPPPTAASVLSDFDQAPPENADGSMMPNLDTSLPEEIYANPEMQSIPLSPGPAVALPPPVPPQQPQQPQYAPQRAARRAPARRQAAVPNYMGAPVAAPPKPSLAFAFQSAEGVLHVIRMEGDREAETLPREYPRAYYDACGGDFRTFLMRHVVGEHGGGTYMIRAIENNVPVGQTIISIAGDPKRNNQNMSGAANDPRIWASVFRQPDGTVIHVPPTTEQKKTLKEVMAENLEVASTQAMIERMNGGGNNDTKVADLVSKALEPFKNTLNGLAGAMSALQSQVSVPAVPVKDPFDRLMEWRKLELMEKPTGPSPEMIEMKAQLAEARRMAEEAQKRADKAEDQRREDARAAEVREIRESQKRMQDDINNKLGQMMQQLQQPAKTVQETHEEWQAMSNIFGGRSGGDTKLGDVLGTLAEQWTPEAIGAMTDRMASATVKEEMAKEEIRARRRAAGESEAEINANPHEATGAESNRITIPNKLKKEMLAAQTDQELLSASMQIVRRLLDVPAFAEPLGKLRDCIAEGFEAGIESHITVVVDAIYGEGRSSNLAQRITHSMMKNRDMLCSLLKMAPIGELKWKKKAAKKPPVAAKVTENVPVAKAASGAEPAKTTEPAPAPAPVAQAGAAVASEPEEESEESDETDESEDDEQEEDGGEENEEGGEENEAEPEEEVAEISLPKPSAVTDETAL